jgi:peptide/nickel transport system permease protein
VRYLVRRLAHAVAVLLGVSVLTFVLAEASPGSAFDDLVLDPQVSPETIDALRRRYGLDRPIAEKYVLWLQSVLRGDFGYSVAHNTAVGELLWPRARNTLVLTVTAMAVAWLIAVPLGAWAASRRGRWPDRMSGGATATLLAVPDLLFGLVLLLIAVRTGLFPTGGMVSIGFEELGPWEKARDAAAHLFLPVMALALINTPVLVRHMRASTIDALRSPFMQGGRAMGMPERRLRIRYAWRAAANPMISLLGLSVAALLSASFVVETIMSWPGIGPLLLAAVVARDLHVVVGVVICSTILLIGGNLLADMLLYWTDPRVRSGRESSAVS